MVGLAGSAQAELSPKHILMSRSMPTAQNCTYEPQGNTQPHSLESSFKFAKVCIILHNYKDYT